MSVERVDFGGPQQLISERNRVKIPNDIRKNIWQLIERLVALTDAKSVAAYLRHVADNIEDNGGGSQS